MVSSKIETTMHFHNVEPIKLGSNLLELNFFFNETHIIIYFSLIPSEKQHISINVINDITGIYKSGECILFLLKSRGGEVKILILW